MHVTVVRIYAKGLVSRGMVGWKQQMVERRCVEAFFLRNLLSRYFRKLKINAEVCREARVKVARDMGMRHAHRLPQWN